MKTIHVITLALVIRTSCQGMDETTETSLQSLSDFSRGLRRLDIETTQSDKISLNGEAIENTNKATLAFFETVVTRLENRYQFLKKVLDSAESSEACSWWKLLHTHVSHDIQLIICTFLKTLSKNKQCQAVALLEYEKMVAIVSHALTICENLSSLRTAIQKTWHVRSRPTFESFVCIDSFSEELCQRRIAEIIGGFDVGPWFRRMRSQEALGQVHATTTQRSTQKLSL